MSPDVKLAKLEALLKAIDEGVTREEFVKSFELVVKIVQDIKSGNETEFTAIHKAITALSDKLKQDNQADVSELKAQVKDAVAGQIGAIAAKLKAVDEKLSLIKDGEKGETGAIGPQGPVGPAGSPDTAEDIRNKLELLDGEDRLDAKYIKNLPEPVKQGPLVVGGGNHPLWALPDVDVTGIVVGQSIKWDGIRWIPFTPTGANTPVYNEVPTDSGDQTNFTLANTPITGTLRVYRGGGRLTLTTDYTVASATITLVVALNSGEVLNVDYEY